MSKNLVKDGFMWKEKKSKFTQKFIQNYDDDNDKECFLEDDVSYHKRLQKIYSNLLFLLEKIKIKKCKKLLGNMHGKKNLHIKTLKQTDTKKKGIGVSN